MLAVSYVPCLNYMKEKTLGHEIINVHCVMRGISRLRSPGLGSPGETDPRSSETV